MTRNVRRGMLVLILFLSVGATLSAQQPAPVGKKDSVPPQPKGEPTKAEPAKSATHVKAFELKNANPGEVQQILAKVFTPVQPSPATKTTPVTAVARPTLVIAFEAKTKTIFVRGSIPDLETAGKVIAQLDAGSPQAAQPNQLIQVIYLQTAPVEDVVRVLNALELGTGITPCPASKLLILPTNSANLEEIKTVVDRLDAPAKPPVKK